ncbi:MAG: hypothetical protein JST35_11235 [Armatimonadetes bacterium]|nr:hypothetical protein [Armatimonadota bacterium]
MKSCAVVAVLALGLVGCKRPTLIGTWKIDPNSIPMKMAEDPTYAPLLNNFKIEFKNDGTLTVQDVGGKKYPDRYTINGTKVTIGGTPSRQLDMTFEGGSLYWNIQGEKLRFKRE